MSCPPPPAGRATLSKEGFLRAAWQFAYVREHGRKLVGRMMVLQFVAAPDGQTRVGLIVSKKVHRRAVRRNRARRLLRESYRLTRSQLQPAVWVVAIARGNLLATQQPLAQIEWLTLLRQAGFLAAPEPPPC